MNKFSLIALSFFLTSITHAATITSVDLSENPDGLYYTVVVQGSGFGDAPNIVVFDDFDEQTADSVEFNKALIGHWDTGSSFATHPKVVDFDSGKAIEVNTITGGTAAKISQIEALFPEKVSNIFISYSVAVPEGRFFAGSTTDFTYPEGSSWKFTWILDGPNGVDGLTKYNVCVPSHVGRGNFMLVGNSVGYGYYDMGRAWSWHTKNYMSFGIRPDEAEPQTQNGQLIFQMTGKKDAALIVNKLDKPIFPETNTTSFDRVQFPGWFGNGNFSNFQAYYDDIYVATGKNAFSRVELSDSADLFASSINLTMPVTSWSDTSITFKINKNNLKKADQLYLRVYDNQNNSVSHHFPCTRCPQPPAT